MACVAPKDVNHEIRYVHVHAPTREFSFNARGDANMSYDVFQVVFLWKPSEFVNFMRMSVKDYS